MNILFRNIILFNNWNIVPETQNPVSHVFEATRKGKGKEEAPSASTSTDPPKLATTSPTGSSSGLTILHFIHTIFNSFAALKKPFNRNFFIYKILN